MSLTTYHGGASFEAIGVDLRHLARGADVVNADVLDAWFDPAPRVLAALREHLGFLVRTSPPAHAEGLVASIAHARAIPAECILPGAGSSSLLFSCLPRLIAEGSRVMLLEPTYGEYEHIVSTLLRGSVLRHVLDPRDGFMLHPEMLAGSIREHRPHALVLVNPNNPTGRLCGRDSLLALLDQIPAETLVLVDETYMEFAGSKSLEDEAARRTNLIVIKSMSKVYALSGMRVAYLVSHPGRVARLARWMPPWPVSLPAQLAAILALDDPGYYAARYAETRTLRANACVALRSASGIAVHDAEANFYLIDTPRAARLAAALRERDIFVREFPCGALAGRYLRISVKDDARNARIVSTIKECTA